VKTIIFFVVLIALSLFLTDFLKSKFNITNEEESKVASKKMRYVQGLLLLFTLALITFSIDVPGWLFLGILFSGFMLSDAYFEWKYNRHNRLYIISLYQLLLYLLLIFVGTLFNIV